MTRKRLIIGTLFIAMAVLFYPSRGTWAATTQPAPATTPRRVTKVADYVPSTEKAFASALVVDAKTKKVLYAYEPTKPWAAASLTKLMGAMVLVDKKPAWGKVVKILAQDEVGGGRLRVSSGASMTLRDILFSSLVGSANNAATAMARISGLGQSKYVAAMNAKAKAIGCHDTTFADPSGMDVRNMTTAQDMLKIAEAAFAKPEIRSAVSTSVYNFMIRNQGIKKTIRNTNVLLTDPNNGLYVTGGKTGYLEEAKNNLVVRLRPDRDDRRHELMIVVFGAETKPAVFEEAARLARWTWSAYDWPTPTLAVSR
jgi:D-alanyl-D-alanine endopeptidase (penicillin-binding protein 7)